MVYIVIFIAALLVMAAYRRRYGAVRNCRWRADRTGDRGSLRKYRCAACGAEAFTAQPGPPTSCKKSIWSKKL